MTAKPFATEQAPVEQEAKLDTPLFTQPAQHICVYTRAWRTSGTGLFAQELVNALLATGADVTFVSPVIDNLSMEAPRERFHRLRPVREIVEEAPRTARALRSLHRIFGSFSYLMRARLRARTFIVTIPDPLAMFIPMLIILRLTGARIIFIAHDPVPHCWRFSSRWRKFEKKSYELCYRLSTAVVVLSEATRQKLTELFPKVRVPIEVIEHGNFALPDVTPLTGNRQLLLFGTLRRNKGVLEAIDGCIAANRAGVAVRLLVTGEIYREEPNYAEECRLLAETAPDIVSVQVGYVDDTALPALIAGSDALLMPYTEFFSQSGVALLAASNARPIIATKTGGIAALIDEGMPSEVIEKPVNSQNVAEAVARFMANPATEWAEQALAYRETTLERRSWTSIARRYAALANRLRQ